MKTLASRSSAAKGLSRPRGGSALILVLWMTLLLSVLVASLTFDMQVEAIMTSLRRKRVRAELNAHSAVAFACWMLARRDRISPEMPPEGMDADIYTAIRQLQRNLPVRSVRRDTDGVHFSLTIEPENARRNVHALAMEDWYQIFYRAGVPEEHWDELIACFLDWTDADDEHRLLGAEKDDPFYQERGYTPRNAPVETVAELALIKGFCPELLYGGPSPWNPDESLIGIANWLTVRGDGRVFVPAASREMLLTIPGLSESDVETILDASLGPDGLPNTEDDGFTDAVEFAAKTGIVSPTVWQRLTFDASTEYRMTALGWSDRQTYRVQALLRTKGGRVDIVAWTEGGR